MVNEAVLEGQAPLNITCSQRYLSISPEIALFALISTTAIAAVKSIQHVVIVCAA